MSLLSSEVIRDECQIANSNIKERWCLDSGCTSHICGDASVFTKIDSSESGKLKLASEATANISYKGVVEFATNINGEKCNVTLSDTLHVPEVGTNLLSVSKIADKGYSVVFDKSEATVLDESGNIKLIAKRKENLYYIEGEGLDSCGQAVIGINDKSTSSMNSIESWHERMAHLNYHDLLSACKNGAVRGIDLEKVDGHRECEVCIQGKMSRLPFPSESNHVTDKLEIVHTDLCGPMRISSNGGSNYFITFTDDRTRWTEVRFLKNKSQALEEFKAYKALVEKQHGMKIKSIQSDNGREFINKEFDSFLKSEGIKRRLTTPYTPEQNGVAKRKNRTLVEAARFLLIQSGLPSRFWAEAISTANHVRNRCPTKRLNGRTPHEFWYERIPVVKYFRKFGSRVFCLDKTTTKGKFDVRAKEGLFIGYSEESKGYRVWMINSNKVDITRDVKFLEGNFGTSREPFEDFYTTNSSGDNFVDDTDCITVELTNEMNAQRLEDEPEDIDFEPVEDYVAPDVDEEEAVPERMDIPPRRGRGHYRIVRTGERGRPRKMYPVNEAAFIDVACIAEIPVKDAISGEDSSMWMISMASEVKSLLKKNTWRLVKHVEGQNVIGSRFTLRNKYNSDGEITTRKARVIAQGFTQRPGIDFRETFAPVARLSSIRAAVAVAVQENMFIRQIDVETAYLNGDVEEEVLMEVPEHFECVLEYIVNNEKDDSLKRKAEEMLRCLRNDDMICLLNKAIYGLKQAGRAWYNRLSKVLKEMGASTSDADPCVYTIGTGDYQGSRRDQILSWSRIF